jgi:hypothetical protein
MKPNISEFSYGYAITDELIHSHGTKISASPVFPSLYQEGQPGGGWDVMIDRPGIPLFLQFKLSDYMSRSSAKECWEGWFSPPFYRMHIRPARFSAQHEMLLDLENAGNEVYYCAPVFHEPWELNEAYLNHAVRNRSIWLRPSWIGPLPDEWDHHVAFQHPGNKRLCSEPRIIAEKADFPTISNIIMSSIKQKGDYALKSEQLYELSDQISEIARKRRDIPIDLYESTKKGVKTLEPIEQIAFYSSLFLGLQLFVVTEVG